MADSDWHVWPVFIVELIAFIFLFFPKRWRLFGLSMRSWIIIILLGVNVGIVISLAHDSTDVLNLHF